MKDYKKQYLDPRWQKKRLEILSRDEFTCTICSDTKNTLNVHHNYYEKGKDVWDYNSSCFSTVCNECHEMIHNDDRSLNNERLHHISMQIGFHDDCEKYNKFVHSLIYDAGECLLDNNLKRAVYTRSVDFNCYDLIEMATFYRLPYEEFFDYADECVECGTLIDLLSRIGVSE